MGTRSGDVDPAVVLSLIRSGMSADEVDNLLNINGIECISYESPDEDFVGLVFFHPYSMDYLINVSGGCYSKNVDTIAAILCSLSPAD